MHIRMQGYFAKGITQEVQGVQEESPELHEHGEVPESERAEVHNQVNNLRTGPKQAIIWNVTLMRKRRQIAPPPMIVLYWV